MATIINRQCSTCKKRFNRRLGQDVRNKSFYCSRACYYAGRNGPNNNNWNGGKRDRNGYIQLRKPDHPFADNAGYVMEHRLVMEKKIGRYLTPEELIHHKNHNPKDNRVSNLEIISRKAHPLMHPRIRNKKGQFT